MARVTGGVNFNLEHDGEEVAHVIALIKKLPEAIETFNSSISIKNKNRISKDQLFILEQWSEKTESFENYLKTIS